MQTPPAREHHRQPQSTSLPTSEHFHTVVAPVDKTIVRGVSFMPDMSWSTNGSALCAAVTSMGAIVFGDVTASAGSACTVGGRRGR